MPIAIPAFAGASGDEAQAGPQHRRGHLGRSRALGPVPPLDPRSFIQNVSATDSVAPHFADWRQINAQALVTGIVQTQADGRLARRVPAVGRRSPSSSWPASATRRRQQNWRRIAHIIADEIYKRITGEDGYFDTRIVYIAESGPAQTRASSAWRSWIRTAPTTAILTDGRALVLTPRFSPTAQEITYMSYAGKHAAGLPLQHRHRAAGSRSAISPA